MHRWIVRVMIVAVTATGLASVARAETPLGPTSSEQRQSLAALTAAFKQEPRGTIASLRDANLCEAPMRSLGERLDCFTGVASSGSRSSPTAIPVSITAQRDNPLRFATNSNGASACRNPLR